MPKFLQFEGQVRNRRLGKRDTILLVRDIWREKAAHDAEVGLCDVINNISSSFLTSIYYIFLFYKICSLTHPYISFFVWHFVYS